MNYCYIYDQLMNTRKQLSRLPRGNEVHHILPVSMGGSDDKTNLIVLTRREHYLAHVLLYKIHRNSAMTHALNMMSCRMNKKSSRLYEKLKAHRSKILSEWGKTNGWNKPECIAEKIERLKTNNPMHDPAVDKTNIIKHMTDDNPMYNKDTAGKVANTLREKGYIAGDKNYFYGVRMCGEDNPFYGKQHTEETKILLSNKVKQAYIDNPSLKIKSDEHQTKLTEAGRVRMHKRKLAYLQNRVGDNLLAAYFDVSVDAIKEARNKKFDNNEPLPEDILSGNMANFSEYVRKKHKKILNDLMNLACAGGSCQLDGI